MHCWSHLFFSALIPSPFTSCIHCVVWLPYLQYLVPSFVLYRMHCWPRWVHVNQLSSHVCHSTFFFDSTIVIKLQRNRSRVAFSVFIRCTILRAPRLYRTMASSSSTTLPTLPHVPGSDPSTCVLDSFRIAIAQRVSDALPPLTLEQAYSGVDYGKKGVDFTVALPRFRLPGKIDELANKVISTVSKDP